MANTYLLYKTINLLNDKYYVGVHRQDADHEFDGYFGSGIALKNSIKKHGKHNFVRKTLVVGTREYIYELEIEYLRSVWKLENCYNMCSGGVGGPIMVGADNPNYGKPMSEKIKKKIGEANRGKKRPPISIEHRNRISIGNTGKVRNSEVLKGMSDRIKGRKHYHNGIVSIMCYPHNKPKGFVNGRISWKTK